MDFTASYEPTSFYINLLGFHQEWSLALCFALFLLAAVQQVAASQPCRIGLFVMREWWGQANAQCTCSTPTVV